MFPTGFGCPYPDWRCIPAEPSCSINLNQKTFHINTKSADGLSCHFPSQFTESSIMFFTTTSSADDNFALIEDNNLDKIYEQFD